MNADDRGVLNIADQPMGSRARRIDDSPASGSQHQAVPGHGADTWLSDVAGTTASLRRLTFAVTGTAGALPLTALGEALGRRTQAAHAAGQREAAAAFDAAHRYLGRAFGTSQTSVGSATATDRQRLLAAAVRQVHRANALLHGTQISLLRPPTIPPDPTLIANPAALIDDLRALYDWSGLGARAIAATADRVGLRTSELRLLATLDSRKFPSPTTVEAIARGCGLSERQTCAWLVARHRAARALCLVDRSAVSTGASVTAGQAHPDPEEAETPAQLVALLVELKERRGFGDRQILRTAQQAGCTVGWSRIWAVGSCYEFPTPRVLEACLIGCGLYPAEREAWTSARKRLAAQRRRSQSARRAEAAVTDYRPTRAPDPRWARTWDQFSDAMRSLVRWSGRDLPEIARVAMCHGVPVTTDALHYTLAHRTLPHPSTLHALTVGCSLTRQEQFNWRVVRARLAVLPPRTQRLPACTSVNAGTRYLWP